MDIFGPSQPRRKLLPLHFFCIVFSPILLISPSNSVNFKVVSPAQPLMVYVGEDALLPCYLDPKMNAEDMEVRWFRSNFPEVIHLYQDGKDQTEQQILEYKGRTKLLRDNITEGRVVLRINSIGPADEGQYNCFFQSSTFYGAALLELKVAGLGSGPKISVADYEDGGIKVVCTSSGWYPEPEMLWKDSSGEHVPLLSQSKSQQENGLFESQISVVIKEKTHSGLNCFIRIPHLNQGKESTIYIADPLFQRTSSWMVALLVFLVVLFFLVLSAICYFWKQHREKGQAMLMGKVPSFSPGSTASSALLGYIALCLALQVHGLESAHFTVIGPHHPVTAPPGGEAVLPCHLSPQTNAERMEVRWFRSKYSPFVHLYRDGQDQSGEQMQEYRGRTELLKDDITTGNVSLRIYDIQPSDDGLYRCFFQSSASYEETLLELQVAGLGADPGISVEGYQDGGIRIMCHSSGWYPEPKMLWRDPQGQLLPSVSEKISQEADGLFQTEIAVVIKEESNQKVSCHVSNPRLNQERESTMYIAEPFFPKVNAWMVALLVVLFLLLVFIPLTIFCFRRQHRVQDKLQDEISWRTTQLYAADVALDPDTAHPNLKLSDDQKTVTYEDRRQDLPDNPKRFNTYPIVLSANKFTGGRFYWEVKVEGKTSWTVGVCRESVIRTGKVKLNPGTGHWTVWLSHGKYEACTSPPRIPLFISMRPSKVGVFLDYEAGKVSFYNVSERSHLFTFTDTFSGPLLAYFYIGYKEKGENEAPLIICPVPDETERNPRP